MSTVRKNTPTPPSRTIIDILHIAAMIKKLIDAAILLFHFIVDGYIERRVDTGGGGKGETGRRTDRAPPVPAHYSTSGDKSVVHLLIGRSNGSDGAAKAGRLSPRVRSNAP